MKQAFTLIELLVVVLIIGILSAIALPQYEKAVKRSRTAEARVAIRSINDGIMAYSLANGKLPGNWSDLDMQVGSIYSLSERTTEEGILLSNWKVGRLSHATSQVGSYEVIGLTVDATIIVPTDSDNMKCQGVDCIAIGATQCSQVERQPGNPYAGSYTECNF